MKLPLLTILALPLSIAPRPTPLAVTAQLCLPPQKNQPHRLASSTSPSLTLTFSFLSIPAAPLSLHHHPLQLLFKLQVASNPA